jgi:hypothetical protein
MRKGRRRWSFGGSKIYAAGLDGAPHEEMWVYSSYAEIWYYCTGMLKETDNRFQQLSRSRVEVPGDIGTGYTQIQADFNLAFYHIFHTPKPGNPAVAAALPNRLGELRVPLSMSLMRWYRILRHRRCPFDISNSAP